jgi:hypothetical protein
LQELQYGAGQYRIGKLETTGTSGKTIPAITKTIYLTKKIKKMNQKELSALTDDELFEEAKKLKSFSITNAFLIGFLFGIVVYSLIKSTFGFLMLIPLYLVHKLVNDPKAKQKEAIDKLLQERNLK